MSKKIKIFDLTKQYKSLSNQINRNVKKVLSSGNYILGDNVKNFETKFSKFVGSKYAISCNSGTDALLLSLKSLNIGIGDEVITTPFTYFATAETIVLAGAKPVFVDINPQTFNIDHTKIINAITKKTKAVMPVHIFGQMANIIEIKKICKKYNLKLIEDCAQSFGAKENKLYSGTFGDFGCFSFFPTKNLGCAGDGGMIITNNYQNMHMVKQLRNHGGITRNLHSHVGYNSRLDTIQAVVGNWLLPTTHEITKKRIVNATYYDNAFRGISEIKIPTRPSDYKIVYHLYMVLAERRDELLRHCIANGIEAKIHYPVPIYLQPALLHLGHKQGDYPVADEQAKSTITFPCDQHLSINELDYIISTIKDFYS